MKINAQRDTIKIKVFILFIFITLMSCTKQNPIEEAFYTKPNEYWQYYTETYHGPSFLKFNKNKTSVNVSIEKNKFIVRETAGDVLLFPLKWSVSKDSILTWDHRKYDIVSYNDKLILLYTKGKNETNGKIESGFIYLIKGTIDNVRKEPGYYGHKRELHPEKYIEK
ncbi:hypothetical protein ACFFLS_25665 [Flavobacterium procerum]|uniref:Lipoprotein n=1 Tax=Flavobacterium procerum TaxID=1455569 RepID=A0ABV6BYD4_9FLAO